MGEKRRGRPPRPPEERMSTGTAATVRLTPRQLAELRTVCPPGASIGAWLRDLALGYVAGLRFSRLEAAAGIVERVDRGELVVVRPDDGSPPEQAVEWLRRAVAADDARELPPVTVRASAAGWTAIVPGMPDVLLPGGD